MPLNEFIISSEGIRFIQIKKNNKWSSEEFNPTKKLKELFENKIDINGDIKKQITETRYSSEFYYSLIEIFRHIVQLRNSKVGDASVDYILSPVLDEKGNIFDSTKLSDNEKNIFPIDADANGAYHIALKGLMALETITADGKIRISNKNNDWFKFIQEKKYMK